MIDRSHKLSISRQTRALGLSRGTAYYQPKPPNEQTLALMHRLDRLHTDAPFAGARMLRAMLRREGILVGRRRVSTLMRRMGVKALYRKPRTTQPAPGHKTYPYLLRGLSVTRPNQVWAMDITYIPMAKGFVYLTAVLDWHTRRVLSWRLSNTMDVSFCLEAVIDALAKHGPPEIMNTDQGSQFTSEAFTALLKDNGICISMDGRGAWRDNVLIERLWRSVKCEEVYLHAYESVSQAKAGLDRYLRLYNSHRPHSSLDDRTPDEVYFDLLPLPRAA